MSFPPKSPLAATLLLALLSPNFSRAAIIFSNLGAGSSHNTSAGNVVGNDFSGDNVAEADTFTPTSTAQFGSLKIALSSSIANSPASYTVSLRSNTADAPAALIESFTASGAALGPIGSNNPLILFTSVLKPTLTSGTHYWIAVSTTVTNSIAWNFNTTGDTSDEATSSDGGATWFSPSGSTPGAYELDTAPIPEPTSLWPLAGPLSLLLSRRNRNPLRPHFSK